MTSTRLIDLLRTGLVALSVGSLVACVGDPPEALQNPDNPDPTDPGNTDPTGFKLSGTVMDYTDLAGALQGFSVATNGLTPPVTATSATDGAYLLANIAEGSTIQPAVTPAANALYRPTTNTAVLVNADVTQNVYAVAEPWLTQQLLGLQVEAVKDTAVLAVELVDPQGQPLVDIPAADIQLLDDQQQVGAGPYFFGTATSLSTVADVPNSVAIDGRARAMFLNVPPGSYKLNVPNPDNVDQPYVVDVTFVANSAVIAATAMPTPAGVGLPSGQDALYFTGDIYPLLQRVALTGFGCAAANCHSTQNPALTPQLRFDKEAALLHADMVALTGTIDNGELSTLYKKPLRELPPELPDHPNYTCVTGTNAPCAQILLWITQGAPLAPPP
ncbi:MAG: hypothetical protein MJE77_44660 [Proteobacteria bacterium]|nr:hypothetical protein [Pseudomonadota bacterium]